jgi:hypothetical protein
MAVVVARAFELWDGRGRRVVYGKWLCAVQTVYYSTPRWHIQKIHARWCWSRLGIEFKTLDCPKKLQWRWSPKLQEQAYLAGPWESLRPGSTSHGTMILQISSNGLYMFGHDYGSTGKDKQANFGVLLFGRSRTNLESAWTAMSESARIMLPLTKAIDFPADGPPEDVTWEVSD